MIEYNVYQSGAYGTSKTYIAVLVSPLQIFCRNVIMQPFMQKKKNYAFMKTERFFLPE